MKVIEAYPLAASKADGYGLIPLFLCVMREDSTLDICKALCKVNPDGPKTMNLSHSYPLHFAAKKKRPKNDREDLKRLLSKSNIEEVTVKVSLPKMYKFFDTWAKDHIGHKVGSNSKDLIVYLMKLVQDHEEFKGN